ncbi:MAG: hypothetical protein K6E22_13205 [Treponema sp.]|nr:hypothetical protein [Treponema sp.]
MAEGKWWETDSNSLSGDMHISTGTITNCIYIVKLIVYNRRKVKKCDHLREKCDQKAEGECKTLQDKKMRTGAGKGKLLPVAGGNPQAAVEKGWKSVTFLKRMVPDKLLLNGKSNSLYYFLLLYMLYMHTQHIQGACLAGPWKYKLLPLRCRTNCY